MAIDLTFLTPLGVVLALGVLLPVAALAVTRGRARRLRGELGMTGPAGRDLGLALGALIAAGALLGVAAMQPVLERTKTIDVRTDTEVFVVLDTTRSMLAKADVDSPTRFSRAKAAAVELRAALTGVPVGVASMTDRLLPHLFPGADERVFRATVERSIGVERPPPAGGFRVRATELDSLGTARTLRFFSTTARHRVLVVVTDGETEPVNRAKLTTLLNQAPKIDTILVHVWGEGERVYRGKSPELQYRPDPRSREGLDGLADAVGGSVYSAGEVDKAAAKVRALIGEGPTVIEGESSNAIALAPFVLLVAFAPVILVLWRRDR